MSHLLLLCSIIIMFPSGKCPPTDHYFHNNNNNTTTTNTTKYYLLFPTPRCLRQLQQPGRALSVPPPEPWPRERGGYGAGWCTGDAPIPAPLRSVPAAPGASPPRTLPSGGRGGRCPPRRATRSPRSAYTSREAVPPPQPTGGSGRGRRTGEGRAPDPSVRPALPFPLLPRRTCDVRTREIVLNPERKR